MKAIVIIPTYNEKKNISRLIKELKVEFKKIKNWKLEILVVDGNSPDKTYELITEFKKRDKRLHLLVESKKQGLGSAYFLGMKEAFQKLGADVVVIMDADLSHRPEYLPNFLKKIEKNDFVVGSRYIAGGSIAQGWAPHRKFLSIFGNKITALILGTNIINDWTSGYRAIRKSVFRKVAPLMQGKNELKGYTFNMSFAYFAIKSGFRVDQVPIKFIDRTEGKSKLGFEYLLNTPIFLFKTRLKEFLHI